VLLACHAVAAGQELFGVRLIDSLKHALQTRKMTREESIDTRAGIGINYNAIGQYDSARIYISSALAMPGGREWQSGRLIVNLGNSYGFQGRYAEALKVYLEALEVSERLVRERKNVPHASINVVRAMANMSEIHYLMGNRKQALHYAGAARDREAGRLSYIAPQYLYIIGSVHLDAEELDKAEEAMLQVRDAALGDKSFNLNNSGGMFMYVAYGIEGLAQVALARGDHPLALKYAAEALDYAERHGDIMVVAKMLTALSDIHLARGDHRLSGEYAHRAVELFVDYEKINPAVLFNIASAALRVGDNETAGDYFARYSARMKESTDRQFRETIASMEVVYETEKKETRIAALEQQKILYIAISIVGLLLAATIWILLSQKILNERKKKQLAAANAILEWEKNERKRFANDLHDGINGMLSAMKLELGTVKPLQSIRDQLDDCIETIRRMSRGMMPGSLERYGLKAALEDYCRLFPNVYFHFFGEDRRIDERLELTIYYCAYELINNSFRHSGAKNINVQLVQNGGSVSLTVQDDGCGFDEQSIDESSGLRNIHERVVAFNGKIDIAASPGKGTETNIELDIENV
jgi:signal transduction histidine kinase